MRSLHNLHKYIVCKYTCDDPHREIISTTINTHILGWHKQYKKWIYYYTEKYHFSVIKTQVYVDIKIYDKKYKSFCYNWDYIDGKYNFTHWYTHFYRLSDTNPILKMFDLNNKYAFVSHGYNCRNKGEYYFSMSNKLNEYFHLWLSYDSDYKPKQINYTCGENHRLIMNYDENGLVNIYVNENTYIKV